MHRSFHPSSASIGTMSRLLAELALEVISERGRIWFPELSYEAPGTHLPELIAKGMELPVSYAEKIEVEDRKAPAIVVEIRTSRGSTDVGKMMDPLLAVVAGYEWLPASRIGTHAPARLPGRVR